MKIGNSYSITQYENWIVHGWVLLKSFQSEISAKHYIFVGAILNDNVQKHAIMECVYK